MREQYVEAVLAVAGLIPAGRVLSYGDIAALLENGGPRQVGAVMSGHGSAVAWWRVIRANGAAPVCHEGRALQHYVQELTALRGDTSAATACGSAPAWRVDVKLARWNPGDAELDLIDAIAARLQEDDGAHVETPTKASAPMSEPRGGLGS